MVMASAPNDHPPPPGGAPAPDRQRRPFRLRWRIRYLLLMLLPGLFFMTVYPFARAKVQQSRMQEYSRLPAAEQLQQRSHFQLWVELNTLAVMAFPTLLLLTIIAPKCAGRAAPQRDLGFWESVIAGIILIIVNVSLAFAGCSLRLAVPTAPDVHPRVE